MFLLGHQLPDHHKVKAALTSFYGISTALSSQLCARLQVHESAKISELTDAQVTQLSAYLSSPGSVPAKAASPTRGPFDVAAGGAVSDSSSMPGPSQRRDPSTDPLRSLVVEQDLRRAMRANIAHHRTVGSYRGRRHQQGLPARGQRTNSNAQTARKLNRIDRRSFVSFAGATSEGGQQAAANSGSGRDGEVLAVIARSQVIMSQNSSAAFGVRPTVSSLLALTSRPRF